MAEYSVRFEGPLSTRLTALSASVIALVRAMLADHLAVREVVLSSTPEGDFGASEEIVLVMRVVAEGDIVQTPCVLHIDQASQIQAQGTLYDRFVRQLINPEMPHQEGPWFLPDGTLGLLAYTFLHEPASGEAIRSLGHLLHDGHPLAAARAVTQLFQRVLTRAEPNGWHASALPTVAPALWFYNTVLPATLCLADTSVAAASELPPQPGADELERLLDQADRAEGEQLIGKWVTIPLSGEPYRLVPVAPGRTDARLYLIDQRTGPDDVQHPALEDKRRRRGLWPVAARVDLDLAVELPAPVGVPLVLHGRIVATRYQVLRERIALLDPATTNALRFAGRIYRSPLQAYAKLAQPRSLHTSIIHGDLSLSNVLVADPLERHPRPMLIAFDRTGPGGHTAFDFVKLEVDYRTQVLADRVGGAGDMLELEAALYSALMSSEVAPSALLHGDMMLVEAYEFIAAIRRLALRDLGAGITPGEYYRGLLGYSLAVLNGPALFERSQGLSALAAYVVAAHAASVIDECDTLAAATNMYPSSGLDRRAPLYETPIGREPLVAQAVHHLCHSPRPVVRLCGSPGTGRGMVARAIATTLHHRGHRLVPLPTQLDIQADPDRPRDVAGLLVLVLAALPDHERAAEVAGALHPYLSQIERARLEQALALKRAEQPPPGAVASDLVPPFSVVPNPMPSEAIPARVVRLASVLLDQLRDTGPWLLTIRTSGAAEDLLNLISQLISSTDQSLAVLLIDDEPVSTVGLQLHIKPWTRENLERYLRVSGVALDPAAIDHLLSASLGLPILVASLLRSARGRAGTHSREALSAAIRSGESYQELRVFLQEQLRQLPTSMRQILELDALLVKHGIYAAEDRDRILGRAMAHHPAVAATQPTDLVAHYRRLSLHQSTGLASQLLDQAYTELKSGSLQHMRALCAAVLAVLADTSPYASDLIMHASLLQLSDKAHEAIQLLQPMLNQPFVVVETQYPDPVGLLEVLAKSVPPAERASFELLVGDVAANRGQLGVAREHYAQVSDYVDEQSPHFVSANARLLRVSFAYERRNEYEQLARASKNLLRSGALTPPLAALVRGRIAAAQYQIDAGMRAQARADLEAAVEELEQLAAAGAEVDLHELVALSDELARIIADDDPLRALQMLKRALPRLVDGSPHLVGRVNNSIGMLQFFYLGNPGNTIEARLQFDKALKSRTKAGDLLGQLHSAQNLAIVIAETAEDAEDWAEAERLFKMYMPEALQLDQVGVAVRMRANYTELLIRRGELAEAARLLTLSKQAVGSDADYIAALNRARIALWGQQFAESRAQLEALTPSLNQVDEEDRSEWAQTMLEGLLSERLHVMQRLSGEDSRASPVVTRIAAMLPADAPDPEDETIRDASAQYLWGLLLLANGLAETAITHLRLSQEIFADLSFPYRAGMSAVWQSAAQIQAGDLAGARETMTLAERTLRPFGTIPAIQLLARVAHLLL